MLSRSFLYCSESRLLSRLSCVSNILRASAAAIRFSASRNNSAARTVTLVVPSPTSSSCTLLRLTSTFAAALSSAIDFRIVAPSFVTSISPFPLIDCRILSIPLGPSVLLTKSPTAIAPTMFVKRAFSAFSSVAPC